MPDVPVDVALDLARPNGEGGRRPLVSGSGWCDLATNSSGNPCGFDVGGETFRRGSMVSITPSEDIATSSVTRSSAGLGSRRRCHQVLSAAISLGDIGDAGMGEIGAHMRKVAALGTPGLLDPFLPDDDWGKCPYIGVGSLPVSFISFGTDRELDC